MKFMSVKDYYHFEDMGFKCGDEVIILINGGEVKHGVMRECYARGLGVYIGNWGDSILYDFYDIYAIAKIENNA